MIKKAIVIFINGEGPDEFADFDTQNNMSVFGLYDIQKHYEFSFINFEDSNFSDYRKIVALEMLAAKNGELDANIKDRLRLK